MSAPNVITVELLINGTWTDISQYVYQRDGVHITGGRSQEGGKAQHAQATLTVQNTDGRFSPLYTGGAYYPYLTRNVQIRISVVSGAYSGYRFWGEVSQWPPRSDPSAIDVYVPVTASGPLRRIRSGGGKGSALTRYYATMTGSFVPIAYWPCEEDPDTTIIGAGIDGGTNMTVTTGTPTWKAISDFNGSAPIGVLNNSTWDGLTGSFSTSGDDIYTTPGTYQWVASTTTVNAKCWAGGAGGGPEETGGGGGGEFAQEATLAVTIGNTYSVVVGAGGAGTPPNTNSTSGAGGNSTFAGDSVTVTAHGAVGVTNIANPSSPGGTGSTNTTHFNGGAGGNSGGVNQGGGGGGGSGGTAAGGNAGSNFSGSSGGAGGVAVTGGGAGGHGGSSPSDSGKTAGASPGGGGGTGGYLLAGSSGGASGGAGKVELVYTPISTPTKNIIRFILLVPKHGGNNGKVLLRAKTTGTIIQLDCEYVTGGNIRMKGYTAGPVLNFTSGNLAIGDGQTVMVSMELVNSGANLAWTLKAIIPGASALIGSVTGTVTTASAGNVTEVIAGPNADITKTALGHISVQYAKINLLKVSAALHGHHTEMGIDRFIRLCNEQALDNAKEFNETADHWGFEAGTQSWVGTNCALTNPTTTFAVTDTDTVPNLTLYNAWPPEGTHSLLMTANGAGQPTATSPVGLNGQPVNAGDIVSVNAEFYAPALHNNVFVGLLWYTSAGAACAHAEDDSADTVIDVGGMATVRVTATAPATAAFFAVKAGNHNVDANTTKLYCDNVRVHPRMGPQTRKEYHKFLEEIEDLDQGILKEAKDLHGLKYRTRIRLINQTAAVTLDYSLAHLSGELSPVIDDMLTQNDITVHRHRGSKVFKSQSSGPVSTQEPPAGAGRNKKHHRTAAEADAQLLALAQHLLNLGTVSDERYPVISVNLNRPVLASLVAAIGGIEIGDFVKIINLPFWYPNTTAKQIVIGYSESIDPFVWTIDWNCTPESPYELSATSVRRW